jgi:hypothetical protein
MAKPVLEQLSASGKAMFDRPLLASYAVSGSALTTFSKSVELCGPSH